MIKLTHYNDGKKDWQSHEISVKDDYFYNYDIFSLIGYGETKEEALKNYKKKFSYVMGELRAFERMLFETNAAEENMVEVDAGGDEIK